MRTAARLYEGEHDFAAFRATGSSVKTSRRRVIASHLVQGDEAAVALPMALSPGYLAFDVTATGFLRHMVRAMVGTLVEIGMGRRDADSVARALASGERSDAGPTAPACGLCLVRVEYDRG
jgi:tRNA pseudouridine38-40 synthase